MNTIINFGDYLPGDVLKCAEEHAKRSDLVLALGSTLQVSPANDLVEMGQDPTRLVICNRYDDFTNLYCINYFKYT
jgi:mono-ADP-ribosyltransferase sirtuin 6